MEGVPAREWKLSEDRQIRARKLAEQLAEYQPEVIICSVEPKAQETAQILAEYFGLNNQTFEGLHEHDRRKSPFYGKEKFQVLVQNFFAEADELNFGSETANQAANVLNRRFNLSWTCTMTKRFLLLHMEPSFHYLFPNSLDAMDMLFGRNWIYLPL